VIRWLGPSSTPAPRTPVASRAAAATSATPMPYSRSRSGSSWIWSSRTSPPNTATFDTPGVARSRGRMTQSTKVRCSISVRVADVTPTTSTVLDDEVSGVSTGGSTAAGRRPLASARRSASAWRAR
jgi:hypothetical protein